MARMRGPLDPVVSSIAFPVLAGWLVATFYQE